MYLRRLFVVFICIKRVSQAEDHCDKVLFIYVDIRYIHEVSADI